MGKTGKNLFIENDQMIAGIGNFSEQSRSNWPLEKAATGV
jgi:hypothetical protein